MKCHVPLFFSSWILAPLFLLCTFGAEASAATADIKANLSDSPSTVTENNPVSISVSLNPGGEAGVDADWWVLAETPFGWYHYRLDGSWGPGLVASYQGPIFNLPQYEVLRAGLPRGSYAFYFGVDTAINGIPDLDRIFYDVVQVICQAGRMPTTGVWRATNGAGFSYLILFDDNTFLYAENDLAAQNPGKQGENGIEAGTYSYDGTNVTFNVLYDENYPGHDSGIGDIGIPAVLDATLSNGNNTLTLAGGQLVLNSAVFSVAPITGVWRAVAGPAFSYLVLFDDGTFLYAENVLTVGDPALENGLEVGTYTYDGTSITFNITYDDNSPGNDSGVGDIGIPAVKEARLSNGNNTLTLAGQLVLTKAF